MSVQNYHMRLSDGQLFALFYVLAAGAGSLVFITYSEGSFRAECGKALLGPRWGGSTPLQQAKRLAQASNCKAVLKPGHGYLHNY